MNKKFVYQVGNNKKVKKKLYVVQYKKTKAHHSVDCNTTHVSQITILLAIMWFSIRKLKTCSITL